MSSGTGKTPTKVCSIKQRLPGLARRILADTVLKPAPGFKGTAGTGTPAAGRGVAAAVTVTGRPSTDHQLANEEPTSPLSVAWQPETKHRDPFCSTIVRSRRPQCANQSVDFEMPILLPITCPFSTFCISSPSNKFWYPQLDVQGATEWTKPLIFPPTTWCSSFLTMASSPTSSWARSFWWDNNRFMPLKENLRKRKWTTKMKNMGGVSNEITVHSLVCRMTLAAPLNPSSLRRVRTTNQYWPHYRLWNICSFCMAQ